MTEKNSLGRIGIAAPYPLIRMAVGQVIRQNDREAFVLEFSGIESLMVGADKSGPYDTVIIDTGVADFASSHCFLKHLTSKCKVILLSAIIHEDLIQLAKNSEVVGIIPLSVDYDIVSLAITRLIRDKPSWTDIENSTRLLQTNKSLSSTNNSSLFAALTSAQSKIVKLVAEGMFNKQIANELDVSESTVRSHLSNALKITNLRSRTELAAKWLHREAPPLHAVPDSLFASLTTAQYRVASLVAKGMFNKQIANKLDISESTVKVHVTHVLKRTNLRSRTELAAKWLSQKSC